RFFISITPRWYSHIGQNGILEDDQIFLHYQERYLAQALAQPENDGNYAKAFYLPTSADTYVSELRKWVNRYEAAPFAGQRLTPPIAKEVLLERYHSHTSKCASCRQALRNVRSLKVISMITAVITWTITPLISYFLTAKLLTIALGSTVAIIAIAVWFICNKLERKFIYGQEMPLRNLQ
ncbi:MAG: cell death suppressor protein Lls1, partial [Pseudanabaena sp.]